MKKLPKILALHLKRFKYMEQLQRYTKLSYRVVFPFELRLFNTVSSHLSNKRQKGGSHNRGRGGGLGVDDCCIF